MSKLQKFLSVFLLFFSLSTVQAISYYTSEASYLGDLSPYITTTYDFDSMADGDLINSGDTINGATFTYDISFMGDALTIEVDDQFDATSGDNYLGLNLNGSTTTFIGGDQITVSFSETIYAAGMYLLSGSNIFDNDFTLTTNSGQSVSNSATADQTLSDGSDAYFIGLIDNTLGFNSITLSSADLGFNFNIDDITTSSLTPLPTVSAVPVPAAAWLFGSSLLFLVGFNRSRTRT